MWFSLVASFIENLSRYCVCRSLIFDNIVFATFNIVDVIHAFYVAQNMPTVEVEREEHKHL